MNHCNSHQKTTLGSSSPTKPVRTKTPTQTFSYSLTFRLRTDERTDHSIIAFNQSRSNSLPTLPANKQASTSPLFPTLIYFVYGRTNQSSKQRNPTHWASKQQAHSFLLFQFRLFTDQHTNKRSDIVDPTHLQPPPHQSIVSVVSSFQIGGSTRRKSTDMIQSHEVTTHETNSHSHALFAFTRELNEESKSLFCSPSNHRRPRRLSEQTYYS
jgi:hypothetical protein